MYLERRLYYLSAVGHYYTLVEQDLPEAVKLLTNMTEQVAAVTSHIQHLKRLVQNKVFQTAKQNENMDSCLEKIKFGVASPRLSRIP
ncbi:neuroguidin-like isoform X2 [Polypterus senegalus]|uniref:neuroguidin-like isoform X2 n=1 Tax=Polypterus senegalus TaxID=55291 RepID=UPI0019646264|nr:neuroguidin-like isoform X2 [Polypterus senegalus]